MNIPTNLIPSEKQTVEYVDEVCGIYFRAILLEQAFDVVPQHTHDYDHVTLVASGSVRLWVEGEYKGDFDAFRAIEVKARKAHIFQALEPMTRLACVHNLNGAEYKFLAETKVGA